MPSVLPIIITIRGTPEQHQQFKQASVVAKKSLNRFTIDTLTQAYKPCAWKYDTIHDYWLTNCGQSFVLNHGSLSENKFKFCYYCGRRIT